MQSELSDAQTTIAKLTGDLSRSREKCLQLENKASSDRGQLSNEIATKLDTKMAEGFRALETSFSNKLAKEFRAELTRYESLRAPHISPLLILKPFISSSIHESYVSQIYQPDNGGGNHP